MSTDKLIIFDTTLRDGEQSPGASMTKDEKLRIARQLERLKVDVIEAPGDCSPSRKVVSKMISLSVVMALDFRWQENKTAR